MSDAPTVLIVDDVPDNIELAANILKDQYEVLAAVNGERAFNTLEKKSVDLILLDVMMPGIDGFELCRRIKSDPRYEHIPVIFVTALSSRESVRQGLEVGGYYYLTKPIDQVQLLAVAAGATEGYRTYKALLREGERARELLTLMDQGRFRFRTLREARNLAALVAKTFPKPEKRVLGLTELMINAVEHGNLGITYDEKTELNNRGGWEQEIEWRLTLPEYRDRVAFLHLERNETEIRTLIQDQGEGFEWHKYLELDPERAFDTHGRGIALAGTLSFDSVEYLGAGNEVEVIVSLE